MAASSLRFIHTPLFSPLSSSLHQNQEGIRGILSWTRICSRYFSSAVEVSEFDGDALHDTVKATEKVSALHLALSQLAVAGDFCDESRLSFQRFFGTRRRPAISTGSLKLDIALGIGGLPKVLPAIKQKWPASESKNIVIQWDNAPPHVSLHRDPDFIAAATEGGFNITLMFQPANSPDTNVNDLGFFRSIQSLQADVQATNVDQLVYAVEQAFNRLSHITLDNVFLTLQTCLKSIMIVRGANNYKIQHMGKAALRRRGLLPNECSVDLQLVRECLLHLLDKGSSDELEGMMEEFS